MKEFTVKLNEEDLRRIVRQETDKVLAKIFSQVERDSLPEDLQEIADCIGLPTN